MIFSPRLHLSPGGTDIYTTEGDGFYTKSTIVVEVEREEPRYVVESQLDLFNCGRVEWFKVVDTGKRDACDRGVAIFYTKTIYDAKTEAEKLCKKLNENRC